MTYVLTNTSLPADCTAQTLLEVQDPTVAAADAAVYTEYLGAGQCVFVDFDLSACVNHTFCYCTGGAHPAAPDFDAGYYEGRVDLMHAILEDIFGSPSGGSGGPSGIPAGERSFRWGLPRNAPNPFTVSTEIRFGIARTGRVRLTVYDTLGRLVRALGDDNRSPGGYGSTWDGRTASGEPAAARIYFCRLEATGSHATWKIPLVK